ncbi:MAG: hypothetical protein LAN64_16690 [Acidobacteriia bacterium]|nr:hypothetical protein [Terriglobia bacterium]
MNSNNRRDLWAAQQRREMRIVGVLLLFVFVGIALFLCAVLARSQELPAAPSAVDRGAVTHGAQRDAATGTDLRLTETRHGVSVNKSFLALTLANAAATAADCVSTNHLIQAGPQFHEQSPLMGAHPSPRRVGLVCGVTFGGLTLLSFETKKLRRDKLWMALPIVGIAVHGIAFAHNRSLYPHVK